MNTGQILPVRTLKLHTKGELIDVFVDQVGGSILNRAIVRIKPFGRIVQCGEISGYNEDADSERILQLSNGYSKDIEER